MNIAYIRPLSQAWTRMKKALFEPFDIGKWFIVGFTAFLAGLTECPGTGNGNTNPGRRGRLDLDDIVNFPHYAWEWLMDHPGWFTLIIVVLLLFFLFIVLLTWLSSRGKFMFLDNVVHDRAQVSLPWNEFKSLGNSLFIWRFFFGLICLVLVLLFLLSCYFIFVYLYEIDARFPTTILAIIGMVLSGLALMIVTGYISLFLNEFVIPIMYRDRIKTNAAWGKFLPLFSKHFLYFILYGLFIFVLTFVIIICVIILGFLTCCIGFLFLIIPYISAVVTLPISYTMRAFSLEFLEQFGPEYRIFPGIPDVSGTEAVD
ncbi:hypothetical protein JXJ21_02545 [candidate division KSB1 bacterium]|nr:hypothetical protein [candidate division KSB1 bacterium]